MSGEKCREPSVSFLPLGAILHEFEVGGRNIVLNFPTSDDYKSHNTPYFGETIGRVANRISDARIRSLNNGQEYQLAANNDSNCLHGGEKGWGKYDFFGPEPVNRNGREAVRFHRVSPHGEEGFPGTVECRIWYIAGTERRGDVETAVLEIEYEVELVGDEVEETVVNVTNHSYFNIGDGHTIDGTQAKLAVNNHLPASPNGIPTGKIEPHPSIAANTPFNLGVTSPAVDSCFVVNPEPFTIPLDTRHLTPKLLASFQHPATRLRLDISSTEPAFQFYTGDYIDVPALGSGTPARGPRAGFCIEPGRYVNAVNVDGWKDMVVLKKGQLWGSRTVYVVSGI